MLRKTSDRVALEHGEQTTSPRTGLSVSAAASSTPAAGHARRRRLALLTLFIVLAGVLYLDRLPVLREAARLWIVSDPLAPADAVAVLGGGVDDRPFAAAAYYRAGLVTKILVSDDWMGKAATLGAVPSDTQANLAVLRKLGIPESAIDTFGEGARNTHDEALALDAWAKAHNAHRLIVPSEIFSARRVRWTFNRVLGPGATIIVPALDPPQYDRNDWWHEDAGIIAFQNEILKYFSYRLRY